MDNQLKDINNFLQFLEESGKLKETKRFAFKKHGEVESTAEHTWRLTLFVSLFCSFYPELNKTDALEIALIHDLAELKTGDIPVIENTDTEKKEHDEQIAFDYLTGLLPEKNATHYNKLFKDYQTGRTKEARLVKALDKAETILQHVQGENPVDFDYQFNLEYGKEYFNDSYLKELRKILDQLTLDKI
ncbi:HD domain-containing protein [Candidatus Enterococcus ferrettii]|uniref:5'-deoxynucleotidase n=1 Tax=Candidatus Enterococcus ferrettii TaxID=2815324 RepID=A0ABV0EWQ4_9ENTE|nr:HD domain-containing protein [Enterococcus sp. 665A]MBO1338827.1 HD domain-containing protein [Enterococcus sp. 665A]